MSKENKYKNLLNVAKKIDENKIYTSRQERLIIEELNDIIEVDKLTKMVKSVIDNSKLSDLIKDLSEVLKQYRDYLKGVKEDKTINLQEYIKIEKRVEYLEELKYEINGYRSDLINSFDIEVNEKFDNCISSIMGYSVSFSNLLDRLKNIDDISFSDDTKINLYDVIENKKIIADLEFGVNYREAVKIRERIIDICNQALDSKDLAFENVEGIINCNKIDNERKNIEKKKQLLEDGNLEEKLKKVNKNLEILKRGGYRKSIDHPKVRENRVEKTRILKLLKSYEEIVDDYKLKQKEFINENKEVIDKGLGELLFGVNTNLKLVLKDDATLDIALEEIETKEDLERFYNEIEMISLKNQIDLKESFKFLERRFDNQVSEEAKLILDKYPVEAKSIVGLSKVGETNDTYPSFGLFVIETLLVIKNTPLEDMNVDKRKYNKIKRLYSNELNKHYDYFLDKYVNILSDQYENIDSKKLKK